MEIFLLHCEYRLAFVVYSFVGFVLVFSLLLGYDFSQRERVHFFFPVKKDGVWLYNFSNGKISQTCILEICCHVFMFKTNFVEL